MGGGGGALLSFRKTLILFTQNDDMAEYGTALLITYYWRICKQSMRICDFLICIPSQVPRYAWVCVWFWHSIPRFVYKFNCFSHLVCKYAGFRPPPPLLHITESAIAPIQSMRVCDFLICIPPQVPRYAWVYVWFWHCIPRFVYKFNCFSHLVCKYAGFRSPPSRSCWLSLITLVHVSSLNDSS